METNKKNLYGVTLAEYNESFRGRLKKKKNLCFVFLTLTRKAERLGSLESAYHATVILYSRVGGFKLA